MSHHWVRAAVFAGIAINRPGVHSGRNCVGSGGVYKERCNHSGALNFLATPATSDETVSPSSAPRAWLASVRAFSA